jgi:hypothetical protein
VLTPVDRGELPTWFTIKARKILMEIRAITFERISDKHIPTVGISERDKKEEKSKK